jgi:DNA-binding response OmpR family regulator
MDGTPATILIVEDHRATRTFLADNLSADGYEIVESDCAADAQRMMETKFPDLAIVDLGLPDRDGLELLRQVRESDRIAGRIDPDLPLLVLSGRAGELDRLRGFDRGCDDYMIKLAYAVVSCGAGSSSRRRTGKMTSPSYPAGAARSMTSERGCGSM